MAKASSAKSACRAGHSVRAEASPGTGPEQPPGLPAAPLVALGAQAQENTACPLSLLHPSWALRVPSAPLQQQGRGQLPYSSLQKTDQCSCSPPASRQAASVLWLFRSPSTQALLISPHSCLAPRLVILSIPKRLPHRLRSCALRLPGLSSERTLLATHGSATREPRLLGFSLACVPSTRTEAGAMNRCRAAPPTHSAASPYLLLGLGLLHVVPAHLDAGREQRPGEVSHAQAQQAAQLLRSCKGDQPWPGSGGRGPHPPSLSPHPQP